MSDYLSTKSKTRPARQAKDRRDWQKTGKKGKRPEKDRQDWKDRQDQQVNNFKKYMAQAQAVAAAERLWCGRFACLLPLVNLPSTKLLFISMY